MNLSEALDAALPEIPRARLARGRPPCLDPEIVVREDTFDGEPIFCILQRDKGNFFRLPPAQWQLARLFDGVRSYEEIAELYSSDTGTPTDTSDIRLFAENMEEANFWYKTPQEKNLALNQKLLSQRERLAERKSKINLTHMSISGWDPDRYLTRLDGAIGRYLYSSWSVLAMVLLFLFETAVFISKWNLIGPDIPLYYNFTQKTLLDVLQFWVLFFILGFIHESAHGLTCKHYGGQVHSMGLMFLYLMPAFYVDVTEIWISASKVQRLATIIAGIWSEMIVCGFAMVIWLNTAAGQWWHDFSYQIILITGVFVVLVNLNPLIKLDGYYVLAELVGVSNLKEQSTAFLSAWFQSRVLGLAVETPVVARRRAPLFVLYALLSGIYSYLLLFVVVRLSYNITSKWMAEFALVPAGALAFLMFRSRLRALGNVFKRIWLERFGSGRSWRPIHLVWAALCVAILFLPLWRDQENAYYVIEPMRLETVHAAVPGRVEAVLVREGEAVRAGQPLLRMSSSMAASMDSAAAAQTVDAGYAAINAELRGQSIAGSAAGQNASLRATALAREAQSSLVIAAPAAVTVLTQDPDALLGQDVASGQPLLDLADAGPPVVRIYIPVSTLERIPLGAQIALTLPGKFSVVRMTLAAPGGDPVPLPSGLVATQDYKGIKLPVFYCARMPLPMSAGNPPLGTSGQAKVFGVRRSLAGRVGITALNLVKSHIW